MKKTKKTTKRPTLKKYEMIYPRVLWVMKNATIKAIQSKFDTRLDEDFLENHIAVTCSATDKKTKELGFLVCTTRNKFTPEIAAHEATHFALDTFLDIGAETYQFESIQEPLAYLVQFGTKCILE